MHTLDLELVLPYWKYSAIHVAYNHNSSDQSVFYEELAVDTRMRRRVREANVRLKKLARCWH